MSVTVSADATRRALATLAGHLQDPEGLDSAGRVLEDAVRARSPRLLPRLMVLYFLYGLARSVDLLGCAPRKPSWKSPS